jgi:hypothetical protein
MLQAQFALRAIFANQHQKLATKITAKISS